MGLLEVFVFLPGLVFQEFLGPYQSCLLEVCLHSVLLQHALFLFLAFPGLWEAPRSQLASISVNGQPPRVIR